MNTKKGVKGFVPAPLRDRFMKKIVVADSGCWEWTGTIAGGGYGYVYADKKLKRAHRVSYELFVGEIPDGLNIIHKCDNRKCVNPEHLIAGTQSENIIDCYRKGRSWRTTSPEKQVVGEKSPHSKLKESDVLFIRDNRFLMKERDLAKMFNVGYAVIHAILIGKTWKHLLRPSDNTEISDKPHNRRLTDDAVREIRETKGRVPDREMARRYGVAYSVVSNIRCGKSYTEVSATKPDASTLKTHDEALIERCAEVCDPKEEFAYSRDYLAGITKCASAIRALKESL